MPLYEYKNADGVIVEHLCSYKDRPESLFDPDTGEEFKLMISRPNLMASNLADWQRGLSGFGEYDRNLKTVVYGEKHRDEILQKRNLVRESDSQKNFRAAINEAQDKKSDEFFNRMKHYGLDKPGEGNANERIKATEAFWAEQVPSGDVRSNPEKYGVGNTNTKKENTNAS